MIEEEQVSTNMGEPCILSDLLSKGKYINLKNKSKICMQDMSDVNQLQ